MRIRIVNAVFTGIFVLLAAGLSQLTVINGSRYRVLSDKNSIRVIPQPGARGRIFDRTGEVIVDNKLSYDLLIIPEKLNQLERILYGVSRILGKDVNDIRETFKKGFVGRSVPVKVASNISRTQAIALEELKFDIPGIMIQQSPVRMYPYGGLACHVAGYVNSIDTWRLMKLEEYGYKSGDLVGCTGVEEKYDYYLRQDDGGVSEEVDHRGRITRLLGVKQPRNGRDVVLALDIRIQKIVEESLGGKKGSIILMNPSNGEIIAMASGPRFDPSVFSEKSNDGINKVIKDPDAPLINRGISSAYPPGSIFKAIIATAGLENKKIDSSTSFLCEGGMNVGKRFFKCWDTHGVQYLTDAIAHSCDVFFYHTGLALGPQAIHDYALRFGLAKPTGFELPYEASGFIPSPAKRRFSVLKNWFDGDTANFSIGQGDVLTTPLQMTRMMAVFANGGYLVTPYVVKMVGDRDLSRYQRKPVSLHIKEGILNQVNAGLRQVVRSPSGTGNVLGDLPVAVAGKTGTAQAPPGQTHAWFVGYFPFENPKFVICVFLERGGPGHASCQVAREIIAKMIEQGLVNI